MKKIYIKKVDFLFGLMGVALVTFFPVAQYLNNPGIDLLTIVREFWIPISLGIVSLIFAFVKG